MGEDIPEEVTFHNQPQVLAPSANNSDLRTNHTFNPKACSKVLHELKRHQQYFL